MSATNGSEVVTSGAPLSEVIHELSNHREMLRALQILNDAKVVSLEGIWPGTVAAVTASLANASDKSPWLIVIGHVNEAETIFEELGQLSDRPLLYFPPVSEETEFESLLQRETTQSHFNRSQEAFRERIFAR